MALILFFIVRYADTKAEESYKNEIISFEKMTMTTNQIIANYFEDEQHLCDIWASYINSAAEEGAPMTAEEAVSYIRKAKTSPEIEGHLVFPDSPERPGISTTAKVDDPGDYTVSYKNINIFEPLKPFQNRDRIGLPPQITQKFSIRKQNFYFLVNFPYLLWKKICYRSVINRNYRYSCHLLSSHSFLSFHQVF